MLLSEFINRTGVRVDSDEFDAINQVYNNSDVTKDEFCALWCKMNANRVEKAKEANINAMKPITPSADLIEYYLS